MSCSLLARVLRSYRPAKPGNSASGLGRTLRGLPRTSIDSYRGFGGSYALKFSQRTLSRPLHYQWTRTYCKAEIKETPTNRVEDVSKRIADAWINQEKDEPMKHELMIIFGLAEDDRPQKLGLRDDSGNIISPFSTDQFETSKQLDLTAMNPAHTTPTEEEKLSLKVLNMAMFYSEIESRIPQAVLALKHAIKLNPYLTEAWVKLGGYYMMNRQVDEAIEALQRVVSLSPRYLPGYSDLAAALMVLKNHRQAIYYLQKALDISPDYPPVLYNKAVCHQALEEWSKAIECYEALVKYVAETRKEFSQDMDPSEVRLMINYSNVVHALAQCYNVAENMQPRLKDMPEHYYTKKSIDLLESYVEHENRDEIAFILLGCAYCDTHRYGMAKDVFHSALRINENSLDAHVNLGMMLYAEGHYEQSLSHLEHALALDSSLYQLHINAGHVHRMRGALDKSIEHYGKAISLNAKGSGEAYLHLGLLLFSTGHYENSKFYLDEALKFYPQSIELHYHLALYWQMAKRDPIASRGHFDVAYRLTINSMPEALRDCFTLLDEGKYKEFNATLIRELSDSSNAELATASSASLTRPISAPMSSESSQTFTGTKEQLLSINVASLLKETGRIADSIRVYQSILSAAPRYAPAHYNLAKTYDAAGSPDKALQHYMLAAELNPNNIESLIALGNALSNRGQYKLALPHLQKAVDINRYSVDAWHALADCQVELQHYRSAQQSYNHVIRLNPNESDAHVGIGVCFYHLQRYQDAEVSYRQAIEISKGSNALAYYNLSSTLTAIHRHDDAIEALRKSIELEPMFPQAYLDLAAMLYERTKPPPIDQVKQHLAKALELDPTLVEQVPTAIQKFIPKELLKHTPPSGSTGA